MRAHGGRFGARLGVVAAAVCFSTGGVAIKACDLGGGAVAGLRSGLAAATILALLPAARGFVRPGAGAGSGTSPGTGRRTWLVACAYAVTMLLFVAANKRTSAAHAVFLQSTAPLYVLLGAAWLLRERVRARDLALLGVLALGAWLTFAGRAPAGATATDPSLGNLLALASGATWGLTLIGLRGIAAARGTPLAAVAAGNVVTFVVTLPWVAAELPELDLGDALALAWLGVVQIGLAYVCLTRALPHLGAFEASLLLMLEPALAPLWALALLGERPGALVLAGGALIVTASLAKSVFELRAPDE